MKEKLKDVIVRGHHVYSSLPSHFCFLRVCVGIYNFIHKDRYFCFDSVKKKCVFKYIFIFILNLNIFFLTLSLSLSIFFFLCCSNNLLVFFLSSLFLFCLFLYKYIHIFDFTRYVKYMQMVNDSFLILSYIYIRYILRLVIIFGFSIFIYILYYYIYVKVLHSFFSLLLFFFYK